MNETPPKELFEGGPDTVTVEVRACRDGFGNVWSFHQLSQNDDEKVKSWPGGGTRQIGHALLTETVRREAFNSALVLFGEEPGFLKAWAETDEKGRKSVEERLAETVHAVIERTTKKMACDSVREILEMMSGQLAEKINPSEDEPRA